MHVFFFNIVTLRIRYWVTTNVVFDCFFILFRVVHFKESWFRSATDAVDMGSLVYLNESTFGMVLNVYDNTKQLKLYLCACMGEMTSICTHTQTHTRIQTWLCFARARIQPTEIHTHRPKIYKHVMGLALKQNRIEKNALPNDEKIEKEQRITEGTYDRMGGADFFFFWIAKWRKCIWFCLVFKLNFIWCIKTVWKVDIENHFSLSIAYYFTNFQFQNQCWPTKTTFISMTPIEHTRSRSKTNARFKHRPRRMAAYRERTREVETKSELVDESHTRSRPVFTHRHRVRTYTIHSARRVYACMWTVCVCVCMCFVHINIVIVDERYSLY